MELLRVNEKYLYEEDDYCPYWEGKKFTGIEYTEGADGIIYTETSYKNGIRDGICQEFNELGVVLEKGYFKDGKGYGIWDMEKMG